MRNETKQTAPKDKALAEPEYSPALLQLDTSPSRRISTPRISKRVHFRPPREVPSGYLHSTSRLTIRTKMSSLLAKIAALRARRSATELLPTVIGPPGVVKHPTIADEREISDGDSSDEELMLISVTPPPKKLDAAGQRALWRERERERARQKTKRNLMEGGLYEMMTRKLEPERVEKVEAAAEDDEEEAEGEDVEEEEEDEEEAALEQVGWDEEGEEENFRDVGFRSALGEARDDEEKRAVEGGGESQKNATEVADGGDGGKGDEGAANRGRDMPSSKCVEEQTTSDGKVAEKTYATIADTSPISESPEEEGSPVTPASPVKSKSNLRDTPPPQNPFGMVDEEASDDEDTPEGEDTAMEHFANREEDEDDGIERGPTPQKSAERSKLATFHRRWELEREQQDVQTVAMGGRELDVDEAVDLTELMKRDVEVKDNFSEEGGVGITETGGGVGGGAGMDDASREHADNYMKAM